MKVNEFKRIYKYITFLESDKYMIFSDEIYDTEENTSVFFNSIDGLLNYELDGETVSDRLDKIEIEFNYSGGRGQTVEWGEMEKGFSHARRNRKEENEKEATLPPAYFNKQGRFSTPEATFLEFEKKYADAKIEYALSVDKDGFVHKHKSGTKSSVYINATGKDHVIIHNHPSGSHFSDSDLLVLAKDKKAKSIIATGIKDGKLNRYQITKTNKFKADKFAKAVKRSKFPAKLSREEGAKWWLKKNAEKFGYKYTETHTVQKAKGKGKAKGKNVIQGQLSLF